VTTWVLEKDVFSYRQEAEMLSWLKENGVPYHQIRIIPFIHEVDGRVPDISGPVVMYGSIGSQKLAERMGWKPGVFTGSEINETELQARFGSMYLNSDARVCKFRDLPYVVSNNDEVFIKPNTDTKEFAGTVIESTKMREWIDGMMSSGYLEESFLNAEVLVSEPKKIGCEWRLVIVDGQIAAHSVYRQYGIVKPEIWMPKEAEDFANEAISVYSPLDVYVLDICQIEDGSYKVIEMNTFNSAGWYACDVNKVMKSVTEFVEKNYV
jgi:hypothetical protein